jgi:hypothetical protein
MLRALLPAVLATLLPAADVPYPGLTRDGRLTVGQTWLGQEVRTRTLTPDSERLTDPVRLGYTADEIRRWFGTPRTVTLDATGLDRGLITPAPSPGIHPRVLFNPEDLPALRERLGQGAGKTLMTAIRRHLDGVLTGPKASAGAEYTTLATGDAAFPNLVDMVILSALAIDGEEDQVSSGITALHFPSGVHVITARATDGRGQSATKGFTLTVRPAPPTPQVVGITNLVGALDGIQLRWDPVLAASA